MKKSIIIIWLLFFKTVFYCQTTVVDWTTLVNNATGVVNTSNTPNAVVTISGSGFNTSSGASPRYNSGGSNNWGMNGLGLGVDWANTSSSVVVDIVFTNAVCGNLTFDIHDLDGNTGAPFEDKITVVGYDQNNTLIPIIAANYAFSNCPAAGICGAVQLYNAGTVNSRIGRCTNGNSNANSYGNTNQKITFTLTSPTIPNKIKRVTITYASSSTSNTNGYMSNSSNPGYENIVISNVSAKLPPTISLTNLCNGSGSQPVVNAVVTGTVGSPTYLWTGGTGFSSSTALTTSVNAAPSTNTTYTFTATNGAPSAGCTQTAAIQVTAANCSLLPIELISFDANRKSSLVNLHWQTASEKNNDYFTIERSLDGVNFDEVKRIKGAGNSFELKNYLIADENPLDELSYYRLKQTDYNGQYKYSDMVSVEANNSKVYMSTVYPNPTSTNVNFDFYTPFKGELAYEISDYTGRILVFKSQKIESGRSKISTLIDDLPNGIYFLKVVFDQTNLVSVNKIVKN